MKQTIMKFTLAIILALILQLAILMIFYGTNIAIWEWLIKYQLVFGVIVLLICEYIVDKLLIKTSTQI